VFGIDRRSVYMLELYCKASVHLDSASSRKKNTNLPIKSRNDDFVT
jgi:hypothetical protein